MNQGPSNPEARKVVPIQSNARSKESSSGFVPPELIEHVGSSTLHEIAKGTEQRVASVISLNEGEGIGLEEWEQKRSDFSQKLEENISAEGVIDEFALEDFFGALESDQESLLKEAYRNPTEEQIKTLLNYAGNSDGLLNEVMIERPIVH
jgi:hypothetical protein